MSLYQKAIEKISKNVTLLNVIKLSRFICGHYFHIESSKLVVGVFKLFSIIIGIIIIQGSFISLSSPHILLTIEYAISLVMSLHTGDDYFFKYCRVTKTNDIIMGRHTRSLFNKVIRFTMFIVYATRFILGYGFSLLCPLLFTFWCITIITLSSRINYVIALIIFLMLYSRMKYLRTRLERNFIPVNIIGSDGVESKIREVRRCLIYYNNLLDNLLDINIEFQILLLQSLVFNLPKLVFYIYFAINTGFLKQSDVKYFIVQFIEVIEGFLFLCSSALVAESIKNEVEKIKNTLSKQLLRCSDESLRFELELALEYVTWRPFSVVVFRTVPLDISVPFGFVTLCITYVIIFIQFTQFTDSS